MKRDQVLSEAARIISGSRHDDYGPASDSFKKIGDLWSAYLGDRTITSLDVSNMMILNKVSRTLTSPEKADTYTDICGYSALCCEIMTEKERNNG